MSTIVEKLLEEEKEAEKLMYGEEEKPAETAPPSEEKEDEEAPKEESPESSSDEPEQPPKPKRENWKKRYTNFKASADRTIHELRTTSGRLASENEELRTQVDELTKKVDQLMSAAQEQEDPFDGVFTQEDIDLLGSEAIEAMKKAALANKKVEKEDPRVARLEQELRDIKNRELQKLKEDAQKSEQESRDELKAKLYKIVPNLDEIDTDPKFKEYLDDYDEYSGRQRMDLFINSVNSLDVYGVARFYKEYAESIDKKESFLDDYVTPEGNTASEADPDKKAKKRFHISEYNKFMDDYTKGRYRGREKEAQKLELMYDKAYIEGRIYE